MNTDSNTLNKVNLVMQLLFSELDKGFTTNEIDSILITNAGFVVNYHTTNFKHRPTDDHKSTHRVVVFDGQGDNKGDLISKSS